eukprot:8139966-Pyramimonas_sp.AAC.1
MIRGRGGRCPAGGCGAFRDAQGRADSEDDHQLHRHPSGSLGPSQALGESAEGGGGGGECSGGIPGGGGGRATWRAAGGGGRH